LSTPHTGTLRYDEDKPRIPAAAITVEDAAFIARLAGRGLPVEVRLTMEARDGGMVESGNVVAQLEGRERPQEIVVIGGHIDSWDVGQGAHDNGSGVVIAMEALNLLRRLGLAPRRTIRVVLWTNEENGLMGAKGYAKAHEEELPDHVAGIESDTGGARVVQLNVQHRDQAVADRARGRLSAIASLLQPLGANRVVPGSSGADLGPLRETGMVGIGLRHDVSHYFDIHHTEADTLDKVEASDLDQGVASLAITAYVLADIPGTLVSD
ncbi:MAG: M20/M25/M40 family metallo-hydrolase, partial [Myxococcales bacterium]|nr:M20/M25/M40 family metallo-hydrolase [Myxococcales bacterium]